MPSSFGFEKPEDSPGFLLWQTTITWQRLIKEALEPFDISHAQFVVMAVTLWLDEHAQETSQTAIAGLSKLDKMTVSKSLHKLTRLGYVKRHESGRDSRAKLVEFTTDGKKLVARLIAIIETIDAKFFGLVTLEEQNDLITTLHHLTTAATLAKPRLHYKWPEKQQPKPHP